MLIVRFAAAPVAALALIAGPAAAGELYGDSFLGSPTHWTIDGTPLMSVPAKGTSAATVTGGAHSIDVTSDNGFRLIETIVLDESQLADVRGKQYWCVMIATEGYRMFSVLLDREACQGLVEAAK
ncbi:MAG TPA: hypothetical protein PLO65_01630 [Caulobacter sp.]|nr:hypothetical protein [Caulobacter sp.]